MISDDILPYTNLLETENLVLYIEKYFMFYVESDCSISRLSVGGLNIFFHYGRAL